MLCDIPIRDIVRGYPNYHFGNCSSLQSPLATNYIELWHYEEPQLPVASAFLAFPDMDHRKEHVKQFKFTVTSYFYKGCRFIKLSKQ